MKTIKSMRSQQKREGKKRDMKGHIWPFSDLAWPEMKPGDLSGRPK